MAKKYKGRYVALMEIDFNMNANETDILPFDKIKENICEGSLTEDLQKVFSEEILTDGNEDGKVKVTQQYADFYEVDENG